MSEATEFARKLNAALEVLRKSHPQAYADLVNETGDPLLTFLNLGRRTLPSENSIAVLMVRHPGAAKELSVVAHTVQQLKFGKFGSARILVEVVSLPLPQRRAKNMVRDSGQFIVEQVIKIVVEE